MGILGNNKELRKRHGSPANSEEMTIPHHETITNRGRKDGEEKVFY